ncbi:DUF721 domain-containing protein [Alcaligenaceae bacterium CGII-47]|nr:DUF721 domain-containing protein [Alcaligenaceae bacterium CGII-47]
MKRPAKTTRPKRSERNAQVLEWLGTDQHGASVLETARQLMAAEALIVEALPLAMARRIKVAQIDRQRITLSVPGAAHAARLRQVAPTILKHMRDKGWNVNEIILRVYAGMPDTETKIAQRETLPLNAQALQAFAALRENIQPGPLADALERLLRHHRQR